MKAKLKKERDGDYTLTLNNPKEYPHSLPSLSKQNCEEIFEVVDVEKLAEYSVQEVKESNVDFYLRDVYREFFIEGFNKAMELNKDKRFTSRDMLSAYMEGTNDGTQFESLKDYDSEDFDEAHEFAKKAEREFIKSLQQQIEIEVDIEMDYAIYTANMPKEGEQRPAMRPKVDENGCLILKPIR
jgi:hypothetical protein